MSEITPDYSRAKERELVSSTSSIEVSRLISNDNQPKIWATVSEIDVTSESITDPVSSDTELDRLDGNSNHRKAYLLRPLQSKLRNSLKVLLQFFENNIDDLFEKDNCVHQVWSILDELWKQRKIREDEWQRLLVAIQASMKSKDFAEFSHENAIALESVASLLCGGILDKSDLEDGLIRLSKGGLDPFAIFSPREQE